MCGFRLLAGAGHEHDEESISVYLKICQFGRCIFFSSIEQKVPTVGPTHEEVTDVEYDGACHGWRRDEMTRFVRVLHFEASACILWVLEE